MREELLAQCRAGQIEPPSVGRCDRIIRSALHQAEQALTARVTGRLSALGQTLTIASAGPLTAGAIAQVAGLRIGLLLLPVLILIAAAALWRHRRGR